MPNDERIAFLSRMPGPVAPARRGDEASDAQLVGRFVDQWDQASFRDLVLRHGPMVLGVCRRILRDPHAAEDAFQATFLVLARKAGSVRKRESVGPWLYGVARRVALEARGAAPRRHAPVRIDPEDQGVDDRDELERDELHAALHEELGRLPEKYRAPLVLCYIEGLPHEAAARRLGWPLGTVRVRIARGRDMLRGRLIRRGLAPAAVLLALGLLPKTAAAVPVRLVDAIVRAAARVAAGEEVPRGDVPARALDFARKARKAMQVTRLKWAAAFALGAVVTGAGVAAVPRALALAADDAGARAERKQLGGTWATVSMTKDGVSRDGGEDAERIKIDGESFAILHRGHVEERGTIALDSSREPKEIAFQFLEGKHQGNANLAIYAWDGANLKLCLAKDGETRPTDFTTKPGDGRMLLVLKREGP